MNHSLDPVPTCGTSHETLHEHHDSFPLFKLPLTMIEGPGIVSTFAFCLFCPSGSVSFLSLSLSLSLSCLLALATTSTRHPLLYPVHRITTSPFPRTLLDFPCPRRPRSLYFSDPLSLRPSRLRDAQHEPDTKTPYLTKHFTYFLYHRRRRRRRHRGPTYLDSHSGLSTPTVPYTSPAHSIPAGAAFLTKHFRFYPGAISRRPVFFLKNTYLPATTTTTLNQVVHLSPGTYSQLFVTSVQHTPLPFVITPLFPPSLSHPPPSHALAWTNTLLLSTTKPHLGFYELHTVAFTSCMSTFV
jgi:hypothetical protein